MKILITGTSSGIGHWLATHYCEQGHDVWGIARTGQNSFVQERKAQHQSFRSSRTDISRPEDMNALQDEIAREWGRLDAVICCAGIQGPLGPAMKLSMSAWGESLRINLNGTFNTLLATHNALLRAERRAKIVCFSGGGSTGPRPFLTPYAVAKTAVVRMVENLAHEWSGLQIDINALAPGAVNTRMTDEVIAAGPATVGEKEHAKAIEQKQKGGTPLAKVGAVVDFLLSAASDHVSGRLISGLWDSYESFPNVLEQISKSDVYTLRRIVPEDRGLDWK